MCQAMLTGLYTRWETKSESGKLKPRRNKTRKFENMVMSYFQRVRAQYRVKNFYTTGRQKKVDAITVDGFRGHCNTVFDDMECCYYYFPS